MFFQLFVWFLLKSVKEHIIIKLIFILPLIKLNNSRTKPRMTWKLWLQVVQVLVITSPKFGGLAIVRSLLVKVRLKVHNYKIYICR